MDREPVCPLCEHAAKPKLILSHTVVWACLSKTCGLRFASPQPSDLELSEAYTRYYYPRATSRIQFENTPISVLRQVFQKLQDSLGSLAGLSLLDYGCGQGELQNVSREFGMRPCGIERDPEARCAAAKNPDVKIYEDITQLREAQPEARFDLITLWTVIEHLRAPWNDLAVLNQLLARGGHLLISTMNIHCMRALLERSKWGNYWNPTHLYYFDRRSLARTIVTAGFSAFSEWKLRIHYAHHGVLRSWLHAAALRFGMADGLFFVCKAS